MKDNAYINSYDVEDYGLAYICGTGDLDSNINGIPTEAVSGEGMYQNTAEKINKLRRKKSCGIPK